MLGKPAGNETNLVAGDLAPLAHAPDPDRLVEGRRREPVVGENSECGRRPSVAEQRLRQAVRCRVLEADAVVVTALHDAAVRQNVGHRNAAVIGLHHLDEAVGGKIPQHHDARFPVLAGEPRAMQRQQLLDASDVDLLQADVGLIAGQIPDPNGLVVGTGGYPPDFFDLIVIDECHRGGANDEGNWRGILEYFAPAVQIGLTATPKRKHNADTYRYFGDPVFIYSLKDGINDGFLTPFKVRQIATTLDDYVFTSDDEVVTGMPEEGRRYTEDDFNRIIEIKEREA